MISSTPSRRIAWRLAIVAAVTAGTAALLAACGGGTSQIEPFAPGRMIVFGDEHSLIVNDGANNGRKYTVNGVTSDAIPIRDCTLNPLWVEALSNHYGFVFAECNKNNATPKAFMRAKAGAKVEDAATGIARQISEQTAGGGGFRGNDLVTVLIGANDLVELSERVVAGTMSEAEATGEARRRAGALAAQINGLLAAGAKAIVSTVPDMGVTPYAINLNKTKAGAAARLSSLSYEFNATLRTSIDQTRFDGRNYALVLTDDTVSTISRFPGSFGYGNVADGVCAVALPNCTTAAADLVSGANATSYMWADSLRLTPSMHSRIGSAALTRALNNPF